MLPEGLHLAVTGAPLELEARRAHDGRIVVAQRVDGALRPTAARSATFPLGIADAVRVRLLRADGSVAHEERRHLCPNGAVEPRRFDPATGRLGRPASGGMPWSCGYLLSRSAVWGLGADRAATLVTVAGAAGRAPALPAGPYTLEVTVDPDGLLLDADRANDTAAVPVRLRRE
ncbi:MAG: hypothetical protein M3P39_03525, partial [Actinomycetota bacterium]|nr:hypothetical protein [Actinomycetota bacterium]